MKLRGKSIEGPNVVIIAIPRGNGEDIILHAKAILDMDPLDKLLPEPVAPEKILPGGKREKNVKDPTYLATVEAYGNRRMAWTILESLNTPENAIEWDSVDMTDPSTWTNWRAELRKSGFSHVEIQRIEVGVYEANCLNESRVKEARENFVLGTKVA